jgi:hypothetical protein
VAGFTGRPGTQQQSLWLEEDADEREFREEIQAAVDEVGKKEVLYHYGDIDRTTLENQIAFRKIDGRERQPYGKLIRILCKLQPSGNLLAFLNKQGGCARPERLVDEAPEDKLRRLVDAVRIEHGHAGEQTIQRVLTGRTVRKVGP